MHYMSETEEQIIKKKTHKLVKHSKCQKLLDAARIAGDQNTFERFTADNLVNKKPVYHAACMQSIIHRSENKENKKTCVVLHVLTLVMTKHFNS